jgi:hypothetical protein
MQGIIYQLILRSQMRMKARPWVIWSKEPKKCRMCPDSSPCTKSEKERLIRRSEYAEYYERNLINTHEKEHHCRRQQAIVEDPYGTIKRQWAFLVTQKQF